MNVPFSCAFALIVAISSALAFVIPFFRSGISLSALSKFPLLSVADLI
jgi:hypothetical protein